MNKIWVLKEKQRSRGNRWRWSQLSLCPNPGYSTGMQKVFSNLYPLFPKCLLLAGNSNNKLIIIKLLTLAAEFPNHFEILILDSCGDEVSHFQLHMLELVVLTEVAKIVLRHNTKTTYIISFRCLQKFEKIWITFPSCFLYFSLPLQINCINV